MFVDTYVAQLGELEKQLWDARKRLLDGTDDEALHDLRIAVRRMRSLLKPIRSSTETQPLDEAAGAVGRLTTPTRDLEVMIGELQARGLDAEAQRRRQRLRTAYQQILAAGELQQLLVELQLWPAAFRASDPGQDSRTLKRTIRQALDRQIRKLQAGVEDSDVDRHQLRILVKRTRYLIDAFPTLSPLSDKATASLKRVQSALGCWHDHYQWCLKVEQEADLAPLQEHWTSASVLELAEAEKQLKKLARLLPGHTGQTTKKAEKGKGRKRSKGKR